MTSINDIAWLAGYLEGEGSFTMYSKGRFKQFRIEIASTDFDSLEKVKRIMRTSDRIFTRKQGYTANGTKKKPEYYMKVYQLKAIEWMMTIYPLMGTRRKARIKEIINIWKHHIPARPNVTKIRSWHRPV